MTNLKTAQQLVGYFSCGGVQGLLQLQNTAHNLGWCQRRQSRDTKTQECSKDKGLGTNPRAERVQHFFWNVWHISKKFRRRLFLSLRCANLHQIVYRYCEKTNFVANV